MGHHMSVPTAPAPGPLPSVFEYSDFRKYLADYQTMRVRSDRTFTRSQICKLLGLPNTRSFFNDVVKGRELTEAFIERFVRVLMLSPEEAQYFRVLVRFNQARSSDDRELLFDQLISLNRAPHRVLDSRLYRYFREWRHAVIRAMLDTVEFRGDYRALGRMLDPPVSAQQARESVGLLIALGLAAKDEEGRVRPTDRIVTTGPYLKDELLLQYQMQCIGLGRSHLLGKRGRARNCYTNTISISGEGYRRIERRLQRFKSDVRSIIHKDDALADRVYQLNVHLFPVSR
jgi:uncharacterized protein (TIGR02147 family)